MLQVEDFTALINTPLLVLEFNFSFHPSRGVWFEWDGMSPRSESLLSPTIDLNARPIQLHMTDDHLSQSGVTGRRGQYGDRCGDVCTAFNNVKARHTASQGERQQDQEGDVISNSNVRQRPFCTCSASASDRLHAGQINGFHPTLKRIKYKSSGGKKI